MDIILMFAGLLVAVVALGMAAGWFADRWMERDVLGRERRRIVAGGISAGVLFLLVTFVAVIVTHPGSRPEQAAEPKQAPTRPLVRVPLVPVYFATDRAPLLGEPSGRFGAAASTDESPTLGLCFVQIPVERHVIGRLERPTWWTLDWHDWKENRDRHFTIETRHVYGRDEESEFWRQLQTTANRAEGGEAFLFIHGYNVSFDDAVFRTAQLAWDLSFRGAPILYSWPSNAQTLAYVADKDANESSVLPLRRFLSAARQRLKLRRLHVLAHSMGNRLLVQALAQMTRERDGGTPPTFRHIVMAAPDVERRLFRQLADAFRAQAERVTLYASSTDKALLAAKRLQNGPRAGDATPLLALPGIDAIDASAVSTDFLNHSYFADTRLLDDIERLISFDAPLPRFSIARIGLIDPARWQFVVTR